MLSIIRNILQKFIDDIDTGNTNLSQQDQSKLIHFLGNMIDNDQRMSKTQACDYLEKSRAKFDSLVHDGFIPKGRKQEGFKELSWSKIDLDLYRLKYETK